MFLSVRNHFDLIVGVTSEHDVQWRGICKRSTKVTGDLVSGTQVKLFEKLSGDGDALSGL